MISELRTATPTIERSRAAPETMHGSSKLVRSAAPSLSAKTYSCPKQEIGKVTTNWELIVPRKQSLNLRCAFLVLFAAVSIFQAAPAFSADGSVAYTYDALGRITTASYDTGVIIIYTYDANGNRLSQVVNVNTATLTWTATSTPCTSNCWGAALWHN